MKKFILYSIPFFFINVMLLFSCSENANDMLTTAKASSVTTYVERIARLYRIGQTPRSIIIIGNTLLVIIRLVIYTNNL